MKGETAYNISVSMGEVVVIRKFLETLDSLYCPIDLNDHDYVAIMNSIANCESVPEDIEGIYINYDKDEENE